MSSQQNTLTLQTVREFAISVLKYFYPEYKKIPFILPDLLILSVEFLCEFSQDFHENGQLEHQYTYIHGKKYGENKGWYENGQLWYQHFYVNQKQQGEYKWWYENGKLQYRETYNKGIKID